jgi:ABC-type phosphate transport system substrate-binding protein
MKSPNTSVRIAAKTIITLLGLSVIWPLLPIPRANADDVVVVANPSVPYREITRNALRAIFGMRLRKWPDGQRITVFVLPDRSSIHDLFCKEDLSIFPHQYRLALDRLIYSGTGQAPHEVASQMEMRAKVASTSDAIGYLSEEMVDDSVRVVEIR